MTNETSALSYGAKLCPVCQTNEVVWAKQCNACRSKAYAKKYYAANRAKVLARAKQRQAQRPKRKAKRQPQTIRIEIHVYIHAEPANAVQG